MSKVCPNCNSEDTSIFLIAPNVSQIKPKSKPIFCWYCENCRNEWQ